MTECKDSMCEEAIYKTLLYSYGSAANFFNHISPNDLLKIYFKIKY